jgi:hypothetical protein
MDIDNVTTIAGRKKTFAWLLMCRFII